MEKQKMDLVKAELDRYDRETPEYEWPRPDLSGEVGEAWGKGFAAGMASVWLDENWEEQSCAPDPSPYLNGTAEDIAYEHGTNCGACSAAQDI
jgi:hypothetical protein